MRFHSRADIADHGIRDRRQGRRSGADVPERHLHHSGAAGRPARAVDSLRLRPPGAAGRPAVDGQLFFGSAASRRRAPLSAGDGLAPARAEGDAAVRRALFLLLLTVPLAVAAQPRAETRELIGTLGGRTALLVLQATPRPEGGSQVAGEY